MMKVFVLCAILVASAFAQKDHQAGKLMSPPTGKTTPPVRVNESGKSILSVLNQPSQWLKIPAYFFVLAPIFRWFVLDRDKRCPQGFQSVGKQCVQTVNAPAEVVCAPGTELVDGKCVKAVGKRQVCPVGYDEEDGHCLRTRHASPDTHCPEGYVLTGKEEVSFSRQLF